MPMSPSFFGLPGVSIEGLTDGDLFTYEAATGLMVPIARSEIAPETEDWLLAEDLGGAVDLGPNSAPDLISLATDVVMWSRDDTGGGDGEIRAFEWTGSQYELSASFTDGIENQNNGVMCRLSDTRFAFVDAGTKELRCLSYDGETITELNSLAVPTIGANATLSLTILSDGETLLLADSTNGTVTAFAWDGNQDFSLTGVILTPGAEVMTVLAVGENQFLVSLNTSLTVTMYSWDGANATPTGNAYTSQVAFRYMCALNDTDIVIFVGTVAATGGMLMLRWDGSSFIGLATPSPIANSVGPIAPVSDTDVAYFSQGVLRDLGRARWSKSLGFNGWYWGIATGLTASKEAYISYTKIGDVVFLQNENAVSSGSATNAFTIPGAPPLITPEASTPLTTIILLNNGGLARGEVSMSSAGTLVFSILGNPAGFTVNVGASKGLNAANTMMLVYKLSPMRVA